MGKRMGEPAGRPVSIGRRKFLGLAASAPFLYGCAIPRVGPYEGDINQKNADLSGFTLINVTADTVVNYRVYEKQNQGGTGGNETTGRISLAPGDVMKVIIAESKDGGLFAPLAANGGTAFNNVRVDHRGNINLPYVGRLNVKGMELAEVQNRIRNKLSAVAFEPQVYVELAADRNHSVLVSGAVKTPGRFSMLEGPMTIIDAINRAGGATEQPHQVIVVIRRGKAVHRTPLSVIYNGNNKPLHSGDELMLELDVKVFNAIGAVTRSGQLPFTRYNPTLLDAIAQAGGLSITTASNTGVFVFRLNERYAWKDADGKWQSGPVIFRFDFSKPETLFLAGVFGMNTADTVYVTTAPSVEWESRLRPIAYTLSTVGSSASIANVVVNGL